jgi:sulfotransferase
MSEKLKKEFYLLAGLPRSGNTLLASVLNQNPNFYVSPLSPMPDYLHNLYKVACESPDINSTEIIAPSDFAIKKFIHNYYADIKQPIIFDRQKTWGTPANYYNALTFIQPNIKVIFTTRSLVEILASLITVLGPIVNDAMSKNNWVWKSHLSENDNKCDFLMSPFYDLDKIYTTYTTIKNYPNNFLVVRYEDILEKPTATMRSIYDFLGQNFYKHNFEKIERAETYNERSIGMPDNLHEVKPRLAALTLRAKDILSEYALSKYGRDKELLCM